MHAAETMLFSAVGTPATGHAAGEARFVYCPAGATAGSMHVHTQHLDPPYVRAWCLLALWLHACMHAIDRGTAYSKCSVVVSDRPASPTHTTCINRVRTTLAAGRTTGCSSATPAGPALSSTAIICIIILFPIHTYPASLQHTHTHTSC